MITVGDELRNSASCQDDLPPTLLLSLDLAPLTVSSPRPPRDVRGFHCRMYDPSRFFRQILILDPIVKPGSGGKLRKWIFDPSGSGIQVLGIRARDLFWYPRTCLPVTDPASTSALTYPVTPCLRLCPDHPIGPSRILPPPLS